MSIEEKKLWIQEPLGKKRYISIATLRKQKDFDFTVITGKNVSLVPRHNIKGIEKFKKKEIKINKNRFYKETTPSGEKPYTNKELQVFLRTLGLPISGSKKVLIGRIEDNYRK